MVLTGEATKQFPVEKYGLDGSFHNLLEGCTFPPDKESSLAQSLGPMTTLLTYVRSPSMYAEKWKQSAKRAFAHKPFIDDIVNLIPGKSALELRGLIKVMGMITKITTARNQNRAFIHLILQLFSCTITPKRSLGLS